MDRENAYNSERYNDPTAEAAINRVLAGEPRYRPLVYICSPFAGDIEGNVQRARTYCRFAIMQGAIPLAPHLLYPQFMDDGNEAERELGLFMGIVLLGFCKEVWVFGNTLSPGMECEVAKARKRGIPVRYFNAQCKEVIYA